MQYTGLLRATSNVLHKYSAIIPREIFVIPNPNERILVKVEYPNGTSGSIILFTIVSKPIIKPIINIPIPTMLTNRIGTNEKETTISIASLIFLGRVHFELPLSLQL